MASPPKRRYKPGSRESAQIRGEGKMSENRIAWLRVVTGQYVIMRYEDDTEDATETGPTIRLYIPRPGARPTTINVTALTQEELARMREFFNLLFDLAEPVVASRDKVAEDALQRGDDSYARSYRQAPQLVIRSREERADDQGVHDGSESLSERIGNDGSSDRPVRGTGSDVADPEPNEGSPQDDGPTPD